MINLLAFCNKGFNSSQLFISLNRTPFTMSYERYWFSNTFILKLTFQNRGFTWLSYKMYKGSP